MPVRFLVIPNVFERQGKCACFIANGRLDYAMVCYSGMVWNGEGFSEGYAVVEDGRVTETGEGVPQGSVRVGYVMPGLTDGHTHLGDAGLRLDRRYSLEELVAPPDGLKHRYLRDTPRDRIESDMRGYAGRLADSGVSRIVDFREGGVAGAEMMRRAVPDAVIMGRPVSEEFDPNETDALLDVADGIGISSISDLPAAYVDALADAAHRRGRFLAVHVSERIREDIGRVLSLEPDFVVHMCEATDSDLRACADADLPAVICASSNIYFGRVPPLRRMCDAGVRFSVGTDNAMLCAPDIFAEARFMDSVAREQGCPDGTALRALVAEGNKLLLTRSAFKVKNWAGAPVITGPDALSGRLTGPI